MQQLPNISQANPFEVTESIINIVAPIVLKTGERPSTLFGWTDEDDWLDRLLFDNQVCARIMKLESGKRG